MPKVGEEVGAGRGGGGAANQQNKTNLRTFPTQRAKRRDALTYTQTYTYTRARARAHTHAHTHTHTHKDTTTQHNTTTHTHTPPPPHTHTHTHTRARWRKCKNREEVGRKERRAARRGPCKSDQNGPCGKAGQQGVLVPVDQCPRCPPPPSLTLPGHAVPQPGLGGGGVEIFTS